VVVQLYETHLLAHPRDDESDWELRLYEGQQGWKEQEVSEVSANLPHQQRGQQRRHEAKAHQQEGVM
jgi:hypothetical protein